MGIVAEGLEGVEATDEADLTVDRIESDLTDLADTTSGAEQAADDSPRYTVKVDGEEIEVDLDELRNGYQRQQDYTRKTQEVARQREEIESLVALASALEANPKETLAALAEALGVADGATSTPDLSSQESDDPIASELQSLREWREQQEAAARQAAIDAEIDQLKSKFEDFEEEAVLRHAIARNIPDLEDAYKSLAYEQLRQRLDSEAAEAKKQAAVVEGGGSTVAAGSTEQITPARISLTDAFRQAKKQIRR